jgi:hypothetical protein
MESVWRQGEKLRAKADPQQHPDHIGPPRHNPRKPGEMTGEIWIAPDFDSLPDDIADAFGMKEPQS